MPGQQQQRRGEGTRPPSTSGDIVRSYPLAQAPVASIETPESTRLPPSTTSAHTPSSPAQASHFRVPQSPRSVGSNAAHKAAKVAIPRLKRSVDGEGQDAPRSGGRHRVNHACEPCRHRKTKCSGERPVCRHCQDFKIACFYADGKRDRVKKQFGTMTEKVADYERLLNDLMNRVNEQDARMIRAALEKEATLDGEDTARYDATETNTLATIDAEREQSESGAESDASAGAGSTGALDRTDEDFTREQARSTGFMGKNSEVTWLQRLREENKYGDWQGDTQGNEKQRTLAAASTASFASRRQVGDLQTPLTEMDEGFTVNDSSYHLDDFPIFTFEAVDPYEMPTPDVAGHLFDAYMARVHPSFPVVGKVNLTSQFRRFINGTVQNPPEKWLAILNMIFAIGAKYSHLVNAEWKGDERDHLIYFTRARLLNINSETLFQHPDLQQIQIIGLMSFYLLCTSQVNRAWLLNGLAVRQASALGMNMRNDSANLPNPLKEIRYRVWWALYTLEHRLCNMTGRVNCILDDHCTTPLPVPLDEDQFDTEEGRKLLSKERQQGDRAPASNPQTPSNSNFTPSSTDRSRSQTKADSRSPSMLSTQGDLEWAKDVPPNPSLYFLHLVQLSRLTQNIFHRLYNPASIQGTWSDVQNTIRELDEQIEHWYQRLPPAFAFRRKQRDRASYEARLCLGFFYYSAKMTTHRPCLCRLDRKIPGQSGKSLEFNRHSASKCVEAAMGTLGLIPDEPNAVGLLRVGPWWIILHLLVQACTVLMLEISFRANHMPEEADNILEASKKGVRWLHALAEDNLSAKRAWAMCFAMLRDAAQKVGRSVDDLPQMPPGKPSPPAAVTAPPPMPAYTTAGNPFSSAGLYASVPPQTTMYPIPELPTSQSFAAYDPMMQYDQYFPGADFQMATTMPFQPAPMDSEMEFMSSAYHDDASQPPGRAPRYE
ncbi:hypothetical protein HRR83_004159 [Exophiala dermatitidis]|uniref:Zn(2)-C6 fungal-type domain-containing protein n=1 Tax=Exophiala dermatitidis TaxID=5970 RepID=A0AAN6IUB4_EXODE|nr:hypothetical protein HRR73_007802 [Exophiala dermatitidis]KAJ4517857.1 hypothetical protein HRR75_003076 [Exophiala dermatitidis]KAJ4521537.1 hypothetical protein HRR74_003361 [Exophiala dermatitidis]KAJ4544980.1 hypothetical protein HRR76_003013 [Exophiala dermatitidis]KAJ4552130.1 hypothetical protein HRR78_003697 [Exophiala dermatitidis]